MAEEIDYKALKSAYERAEEAAVKVYPDKYYSSHRYDEDEICHSQAKERMYFREGYTQGEKDTIERVVKWMKMKCWVRENEDSPTNKCVINLEKFINDMK